MMGILKDIASKMIPHAPEVPKVCPPTKAATLGSAHVGAKHFDIDAHLAKSSRFQSMEGEMKKVQ
eukprot:12405887-Karenia_brevis.AAC.1